MAATAQSTGPGPKPTMAHLIRLIRGSRESNPAENRRPTEVWELVNLRIKDSTGRLRSFDLDPLDCTVKLEVVVGGSATTADGESHSNGVVVERWKLSVGSIGDDPGTLAANRVFVHSLMGYLKVSEFYAEVLQRSDVRCRLQPMGQSTPQDSAWEKRHFTVSSDGEDGGLSAICFYNKLWRRDLADLTRPPRAGGRKSQGKEGESPGSSDQKMSSNTSDQRLTPAGGGGSEPSHKPPIVPPIKLGGGGGLAAALGGSTHNSGRSGRGSTSVTQSPPLGPQDPASQPVPIIGSLGSGKQSTYTTPPFHPSSLPGKGTGLLGTSPGTGGTLFDPIALPSSSMPVTIGSNPQHGGGGLGSGPGASSLLPQGELPQMVPLVQDGIGAGGAASPVMARRGHSFGDNFAALMTAGDELEEEQGMKGTVAGGDGEQPHTTAGGDFADVTDFMAAAAECSLNAPMINVHDYLQAVLGTPRDSA